MTDYVQLLQGADSKLVQSTPTSTAVTAPEKQAATTP